MCLMLFAALHAGCLFDTSADVPFEARDVEAPDVGSDASEDVTTADVMEDASDEGPLYSRDQLPRGTTCEGVPDVAPAYDCNPVLQDCPRGEVCEIQISQTFQLVCRVPEANETFVIPDGGACDVAGQTRRCRLGARCISGTCRALCEFDGAVGCRESEVCETISDDPLPGGDVLHGYGACIPGCR